MRQKQNKFHPMQTLRLRKINQITLLFVLGFSFFILAQSSLYLDSNNPDFQPTSIGDLPQPYDISPSAGEKTLNISLLDRDSDPIVGADVKIDDNGGTVLTVTSDSLGNAKFFDISDATYDITVTYYIGESNAAYVINETSYAFSVGPDETDTYTVYCNLTKVDLEVGDTSLSGSPTWGLYNASIILQDPNTHDNITLYHTDFYGVATLYLPATSFDVKVQYQGEFLAFYFFVIGGNNEPGYTKNLTIEDYEDSYDYDVFCTVTDTNTELTLQDFTFAETSWDQTEDLVKPYFFDMYYEDKVELKLSWNDTQTQTGMEKPSEGVWNTWTIESGSSTVNSSSTSPSALQPITGETGNYTFVIDSEDYGDGEYTLTLVCEKTGYQDAILVLDFEILNFTTQLEIDESSPITIEYSNNLNIQANYSSLIPYAHNIDNTEASLYYRIEGQAFSGQLTYSGITNNFTISEIPVNIPVGTYDLEIYGSGDNFDYVSETYILVVDPIDTDVAFLIGAEYKISQSFLKTAHGENVEFLVNFTDENGASLAGSSMNVFVNDAPISSQYYEFISSGVYENLWNVSFPADLYSPTTYNIKVQLTKTNYEETNATLSATILDTWDTRIDIVEAPSEYNWGDNATFKIKYVCDEDPVPSIRDEMPISGGNISELNLTVKVGLTHYLQISLSVADEGTKWGWTDLSYLGGENLGVYSVWVLTDNLNLTEETKYYAIPSINYGVYAEASTSNIYFDLHTLDTSLTCYNDSDAIDELDFFNINRGNDETIDVRIQLDVSEETSTRFEDSVDDAEVIFTIKNKTNDEILVGPSIIPGSGLNDGRYIYTLDSDNVNLDLGEFRFSVNATLENYTYSMSSFDFNITDNIYFDIVIPDDYRESAAKVKAAEAENFTFYIDLLPGSEDAEIEVFIEGNASPVEWCYSQPSGDYEFNCTQLGSVIGEGTYTITIVATKGQFYSREKTLQLEILDSWATNVEIESPPEEVQWGHNQSFVIKYYCSENPRENLVIGNATFDMLAVFNQTDYVILDQSALGSLWGYYNLNTSALGPGYYSIWFNTSICYIEDDTIITAIPLINGGDLFDNIDEFEIPMSVVPVGTNLNYEADDTPTSEFNENFNLMTLLTDEDTTVYFNYSVTDTQNQYYGQSLNISATNLHLTLKNKSDGYTIISEVDLDFNETHSKMWEWDIAFGDLSAHEFVVEVTASCLNYTTQEISFALILGKAETTFDYVIDPDLNGKPDIPGDQSTLIVANGENLSISVTFDNLETQGDAWMKLYIDEILLPEEHAYWVSENTINYTTPITVAYPSGIYEAFLQTNQFGYTPSNKSFSVEILGYWPANLEVIDPPREYSWGNNVSMNVSYYCTEPPRTGELLSGAEISELEILLILDETIEQKLLLDTTDMLAGMWGYEELLSTKGPGYYEVWFDSSAVDLDIEGSQTYYIVPKIQMGIYNESTAKPKPSYKISPVETLMEYAQTSSVDDLNLENMTVYLDTELSINVHYYSSNTESVFYNTGVDGATVTYTIYNRTDGSIIRSNIPLTLDSNGIFPWTIPTVTLGNYSIEINATYQNFESQTIAFNLLVKKFDVKHDLDSETTTEIMETPQNEEVVIKFTITDSQTQEGIDGETVELLFNGKVYPCQLTGDAVGEYSVTIPQEDFDGLKIGDNYEAVVRFSKTNYTSYEFPIQIRVDLPVDPYFGIPYVYWIVIGVSIVAFITFIGIRRSVLRAQVPTVIKRINSATKIISKKKPAPGRKFALNYNEEMYKQFRQDWREIDLNMLDAINIDERDLEDLDEELKELIDGENITDEDPNAPIGDGPSETGETLPSRDTKKGKKSKKGKSKGKKSKKGSKSETVKEAKETDDTKKTNEPEETNEAKEIDEKKEKSDADVKNTPKGKQNTEEKS